MTTLFTLACLLACLLIAINQIRITRRIEEDIVTAINQCSRDLSQVEAELYREAIEEHLTPIKLTTVQKFRQ